MTELDKIYKKYPYLKYMDFHGLLNFALDIIKSDNDYFHARKDAAKMAIKVAILRNGACKANNLSSDLGEIGRIFEKIKG